MAFNPAPSHWIASYDYTGGNLVIPLASVPGLSAGEADATTGDIREVWRQLNAMMAAKFKSEAGNAPAEMTITTAKSLNNDPDVDLITKYYSNSFITEPTGDAMADEP